MQVQLGVDVLDDGDVGALWPVLEVGVGGAEALVARHAELVEPEGTQQVTDARDLVWRGVLQYGSLGGRAVVRAVTGGDDGVIARWIPGVETDRAQPDLSGEFAGGVDGVADATEDVLNGGRLLRSALAFGHQLNAVNYLVELFQGQALFGRLRGAARNLLGDAFRTTGGDHDVALDVLGDRGQTLDLGRCQLLLELLDHFANAGNFGGLDLNVGLDLLFSFFGGFCRSFLSRLCRSFLGCLC